MMSDHVRVKSNRMHDTTALLLHSVTATLITAQLARNKSGMTVMHQQASFALRTNVLVLFLACYEQKSRDTSSILNFFFFKFFFLQRA